MDKSPKFNVFLYGGVAALSLMMGWSYPISLLITLILVGIYIVVPIKENIFLFFFLIPFDEVFVVPGIGSVFRFLQVIFLVKFFHLTFRRKLSVKIRPLDLVFLIFLIIYVVMSFLHFNDFNSIGMLINAVIFILAREIIKLDIERDLGKVLSLFVISVANGIIWGLLQNNFILGEGGIIRFSGTHEPNFFALFVNMAIIFLLTSDRFKKSKIPLLLFLYLGLFLTLSMSGIMLNVIVIALYFILNNKISFSKKLFLYPAAVILGITVLMMVRPQIPVLDGMLMRLEERIMMVMAGNMNAATTGRTELHEFYMDRFFSMSVFSQFFGIFTIREINVLNHFGLTLDLYTMNFSHNTYIEMIFSFGFLGTFFFILYAIRNLWLHKESKHFTTLLILRVIIFISATNLSLLNTRHFYSWLIL